MEHHGIAGRHALVTGASSGIGQHLARLLAREGARVSLAARRTDRLETLAAGIAAAGGTAEPVAMDVTDPASVAAAFDAAEAAFGPVRILVNNAGVAATVAAERMEPDDWSRVLDTNLTGPFLAAGETARRLIAAGETGVILNVASILGERVAGKVAAYAASKAGLVQLTKALALEWARHGIRVNAVAPGYMETEINADFFATEAGQALVRRVPMRRLGRLEELDGPVLLLVSDAASFVTGSVLAVDGGHLVSSL